jgi:hypothetical protein
MTNIKEHRLRLSALAALSYRHAFSRAASVVGGYFQRPAQARGRFGI